MMASSLMIDINSKYDYSLHPKRIDIITERPKTSNEKSFDPLLKIVQLEKNIEFLIQVQKQMLHDLHQEIERLERNNRELIIALIGRHSPDSYLKHISIERRGNDNDNTASYGVENVEDVFNLKYVIHSQQREIENLKQEQLMIHNNNKIRSSEIRLNDEYVRQLKKKCNKQETIIKALQSQNKHQLLKIDNMKKMMSDKDSPTSSQLVNECCIFPSINSHVVNRLSSP